MVVDLSVGQPTTQTRENHTKQPQQETCFEARLIDIRILHILQRTLVTTTAFVPKDVITKTRLFKYIENLQPKKENFQIKNSDIFHVSTQNIDCGYSFEPPRRGGSNKYLQSMFFLAK